MQSPLISVKRLIRQSKCADLGANWFYRAAFTLQRSWFRVIMRKSACVQTSCGAGHGEENGTEQENRNMADQKKMVDDITAMDVDFSKSDSFATADAVVVFPVPGAPVITIILP